MPLKPDSRPNNFGAILTDYLGLPAEDFPFEIPEEFHRRAGSLWKNILELGNFGKNKKYLRSSGPIHGLQHLWRIAGQALKFHYYAPTESYSACLRSQAVPGRM